MHGPIATHRSSTGVPSGRLAVWWLLASEIFIFGGLVACFLLFKFNGTPGFEDASQTSVVAGAVNTFVLLTSSLSIVLAHAAVEKSEPGKSFKYIWYTIFGGLVFLCIKTYEYTGKIFAGNLLTENLFWSFYYIMNKTHSSSMCLTSPPFLRASRRFLLKKNGATNLKRRVSYLLLPQTCFTI